MLRALALVASLTFAGAATAQYKWTDQNGTVQYGDAPPAGVNAAPMRRAPVKQAGASDASDAKDSKDSKDSKGNNEAKKGPQTTAEQDAAFRKRQQEAEKERDKQAKADSAATAKRENCDRAQEYVRTLETGRVAGTDAKGERYFLDDGQLAQESAKARQNVRDWCN